MATLPKIVVEGGPIVYGYMNPSLTSFARLLSAKIMAGPSDKLAQLSSRASFIDAYCKPTTVSLPVLVQKYVSPYSAPYYPFRYSPWTYASPYAKAAPAPVIVPGNVLVVCPGDDIVVGWDNAAFTTYMTNLKKYLDDRKKKGWYVVVTTVLPRVVQGFPAFATWASSINAQIRTWAGNYCHAICDFAADPIMGISTAPLNTIYYTSGIYPTAKGQAKLKDILYAKLKAVGRI